MSRMTALLIASIACTSGQAQVPESASDAIARYEQLTRGDPDCRRTRASDEIVVCGRREADRYRVPLIVSENGDPRIETVADERLRYQHQTTPCQNYEFFLVGCGMAGFSVSTKLNGSGVQYRKLAD